MRGNAVLIIFLSFLLAILLMIFPVPVWVATIWPIWLIPVVSYWIMATPHRVGYIVVWCSGIVIDILNNSLLGEHALALLMVAAVMLKIHQRFSFFSVWQQIFTQFFLAAMYLGALAIIQKIIHQPVVDRVYWWPVLTTGIIWPFVFSILRRYRQRFRIT